MAQFQSVTSNRRENVFPALLRYWRQQRGSSQLDLSVNAEVSARHISFLETGRSQPSVEMVLLLAESLDVPLRDRNEMLRAAGFEARYPEPTIDDLLGGPLGLAIDIMLEHHEPYPMVVFDRLYDIVGANRGAAALFSAIGLADPAGSNLLRVLFAEPTRHLLTNWEVVTASILRRLQGDCLQRPNDDGLANLLAELLADPVVPSGWRKPDDPVSAEPTFTLRARIGETELAMLATITTFSAPSSVTLDELQIESYLPLDEETASFFKALAELA